MEIIETPYSRFINFVAGFIRRIVGQVGRTTSMDRAEHDRSGWTPPAIPNSPPPELGRFVDVVPVAQTRTIQDTDITLIAVELYAGGMRLSGFVTNEKKLRRDRHIPPSEFMHFLVVGSASDDAETRYQCWPESFNSDGRFTLILGPVLNPNVAELTIALSEVRWVKFGPHHQESNTDIEPGPWQFTVRLNEGNR
jgi:hypothetical protein